MSGIRFSRLAWVGPGGLFALFALFALALALVPGVTWADPDDAPATDQTPAVPAAPDTDEAPADADTDADAHGSETPEPLQPLAGEVRSVNGIEYTRVGVANRALRLDVVMPPAPTPVGGEEAAPADGPYPTVVMFHGGSFVAGDRGVMRDLCQRVARHGFVAVSVEYRLIPYQLPDMINDAKTAIRFLRAHAGKYRIDPLNVAAAGHSAGGALALMLAVTPNEPGRETDGGFREQSSRVQAGISLAGVSDFGRDVPDQLKQLDERLPARQLLLGDWGVEKGSPARLVDAGDAPLLLIHGTSDNVVPPAQSKMVAEACQKCGVPCHCVDGEGWGHNFVFRSGQRDRTVEEMVRFLRKHLVHTPEQSADDF